MKIQKICFRIGGEVRNVKSELTLTLTLSLSLTLTLTLMGLALIG